MKIANILNAPGEWRTPVRVSESMHMHLCCPSIGEVCQQRDSFGRLLYEIALPLGHSPSMWWKLLNEAEEIIENLTGDFSI
jgi:hypothetical protein